GVWVASIEDIKCNVAGQNTSHQIKRGLMASHQDDPFTLSLYRFDVLHTLNVVSPFELLITAPEGDGGFHHADANRAHHTTHQLILLFLIQLGEAQGDVHFSNIAAGPVKKVEQAPKPCPQRHTDGYRQAGQQLEKTQTKPGEPVARAIKRNMELGIGFSIHEYW